MKKLSVLSLLALVILGMMTACNNKTKAQEPAKAFNVIYMIGDGMALPQVYAAMLASGEDSRHAFSQQRYH